MPTANEMMDRLSNWFDKGREDYAAGRQRDLPTIPDDAAAEWERGWNDAHDEEYNRLYGKVHLELRERKFGDVRKTVFLCDERGKAIGKPGRLTLESDDTYTATVTFGGLTMDRMKNE